jgi:CDP-paratose synthetase
MLKAAYEQQCTASSTPLNFGALPYRDGEMMDVDVDNTALLELGWRPEFDLSAGLQNYKTQFSTKKLNNNH